MKDSQLEKMSVDDLVDLRGRIDVAIAARRDQDRSELKRKLAEMAEDAGYELDELLGGAKRGGRGKAKAASGAVYRNPADPTQTWGGRGRKPRWLNEAGGDIERFRIS